MFFLTLVTLPNYFFKKHIKLFFFLGLSLRIICIFIPPIWEDDWARYLWEGNLIRNLISPYEISPLQFFKNNSLDPIPTEILSKINHPEWTTIYSPMVLLYFSLFTAGFSTVLLKFSYLFFETITFFHVTKKKINRSMILYWLFPVLIKEVYINLHFEAIIISMFWIFYQLLKEKKINRSSFILGLLIQTKLIAIIYCTLLIPYLYLSGKKKKFIAMPSLFLSFLLGFLILYIVYFLMFPATKDFGFSNLQKFGDTFTFNQMYEPMWTYLNSVNLRSFPFFFQFILLFAYLYLLIPKRNRNRRFLILCRKHHFVFYFGYFLLTLLPVYNPWYFLILIPLISISRVNSILPWVLITILQLSYLTNIRLNISNLFFYQISDPILIIEAIVSLICLFFYFNQIFILLYKISNISNIVVKESGYGRTIPKLFGANRNRPERR